MRQLEFLLESEPIRFVGNGLAATAIHFAVLSFLISIVQVGSAGLANLIASIFGITASFLGSRYFVFKNERSAIAVQATRFALLYGCIAVIHGSFLFFWSDIQGLDYRIGFLIATGIQVSMSYIGNKFLVFSK
jgi:putative flippase GtrA